MSPEVRFPFPIWPLNKKVCPPCVKNKPIYQIGEKCRSIFVGLAYDVGAALARTGQEFIFEKRSNYVRTIFEDVVRNSTVEEIERQGNVGAVMLSK